MAAAVKQVNAHAETMGSQAALFMNINAAKGLLEVMKTNLGPRGTIKMLVGGAGGELVSLDGGGKATGAGDGHGGLRRVAIGVPPPSGKQEGRGEGE